MDIDHNPKERRTANTIWWVLWPIIGLLWASNLYFGLIDKMSVLLGLGTGAVLATWAIEITGNRAPESWTRKPPRS
ncbi:hypothetical protein X730_12035 [Mesorhizobium sp. L103C565B0]|nr:hypothetical protein X730_12035 [Mesorhizobium sp. L103C565B0]